MKSACRKDIFRQILYNPRRFIAIFLIVALGVAFFSGVRATCPDMRLTLDKYFDENNASDIHLLATLGFDANDLEAIAQADEIQTIMPAYSVDGFLQNGDSPLLIKFQSLDIDHLQNDPDQVLNKPVVVEGTLPQSAKECLVDEKLKNHSDYKIGDTITILSDGDSNITDAISSSQYTISGFARSSEYISFQRGTSSKGSGSLDGFIYLPVQNFISSVYTDIYIKIDNGSNSRFSDSYKSTVQSVCDKIDDIGFQRKPARYEQIKTDAENKLNDARQEISQGEQKLDNAEKELQSNENKLSEGEKELSNQRSTYTKQIAEGQKRLDDAKKELDDSADLLSQKEKELNEGKAKLDHGYADLEKSKAQMDEGKKELQQLQKQIDLLNDKLNSLPADSPLAVQLKIKLSSIQNIYQENNTKLKAAQSEYASSLEILNTKSNQLKEAESVLNKSRSDYKTGKAVYEKNLAEFLQQKTDGAQQLNKARKELDDSRKKLEEARSQYDSEKADALIQLDNARQTVSDGESKLSDLKEPEWYVLDLSKNIGFEGYEQDTARVAAIGLVFPLIFFLVAALVSLTNMTRMVEDDRSNIGVLKALGYGRMAIASKYLIYAGTAAAGGIALGVIVGGKLFPWVIYNAYGILYRLPSLQMPINKESSLQAGLGAMVCAVVPAFLVCQKELMSTPASLMRPRAPKEGKRILLERIPFIWKHLNFSKKVTCRNIFRYKKRLFMTVFGIAGCTALIFTGFGLKDSIKRMVPIQYDEIQKYDMLLSLKENGGNDIQSVENTLNACDTVSSYMVFHQQAVDAVSGNHTYSATMIVPLDENQFSQFISLRNRQSGHEIQLSDNGVVLSEKICRMMGIQKGDTVEFRNADNQLVKATVEDITENYVYHYMYMTPTLYQQLYGTNPALNALYGRLNDSTQETEDNLSSALLSLKPVSSVSFNTALRSHFNDMIKALDIVVLVLILSAAALAFVVLFSLTSINIDERKRELATLKVLGFYDKETEMYLYRENIILTLLGMNAGLFLGYFLLSFVLTTAEVDMVMFTRQTSWFIYAISSLLTLIFSVAVNVLMSRTIKRIDMVESLKSVE